MKNRSNALRFAALTISAAVAALLGACASDNYNGSANSGFGSNMPNWNNNAAYDGGSSTAGPEGDAGRAFDQDYDRRVNGSWWNRY